MTIAEDRGIGPPTAGDVGGDGDDDLAQTLGRNLRRLRTRQGLSLERLSRRSGVSRAMLGQIELGRSTPTIALLWKVAKALSVPFAALLGDGVQAGPQVLRRERAKLLASQDGRFRSRALFPPVGERRVEFYELVLAAGGSETSEPHPPGTIENLVVANGTAVITMGGLDHRLRCGDAIRFEADQPHAYGNDGTEDAVMYLVMIYADVVG